jgi:hypothetical protein
MALPIEAVHGEICSLYVRPSDEYSMSDNGIDWRSSSSSKKTIMSCTANSSKSKFHIKSWCDRERIPFEETQSHKKNSVLYLIKLHPIIKLRNLLPYDLQISIKDTNESHLLESGQENDLPCVQLGETGIEVVKIKFPFTILTFIHYTFRN